MRKLFLSLALVVALAGTSLAQAPTPITRRVIASEQLKSETAVTVNAGADDGVTAKWKAYFVDDKGDPVPDGELTLIRVDKKTTRLRTSIPHKEAIRYKVRLEP